MSGRERGAWIQRLHAASAAVLHGRDLPDPQTFRDESGAHRASDEGFLSHVGGRAPARPAPEGAPADVRWWWGVCRDDLDLSPPVMREAGPAPGVPPGTIETFTEAQLSCVHAAVWLGLKRRDERWLAAATHVVAWLIDEVQPDNATNRPWGVHAFVLLGPRLSPARRGAADLYAQTLLHNCQVYAGAADVVSAFILRDAARAMERWEEARGDT